MAKWIVMIDDDLDMHYLYQKVFDRIGLGSSLKLFEDGEQALDYLHESGDDVQLIFSDINMPGMDGLELRRLINLDHSCACRLIPFIFLSTSARDKEVKAAYELMVQGFFQKGSTIDALEKTIRIALSYWTRCRVPSLPTEADVC